MHSATHKSDAERARLRPLTEESDGVYFSDLTLAMALGQAKQDSLRDRVALTATERGAAADHVFEAKLCNEWQPVAKAGIGVTGFGGVGGVGGIGDEGQNNTVPGYAGKAMSQWAHRRWIPVRRRRSNWLALASGAEVIDNQRDRLQV